MFSVRLSPVLLGPFRVGPEEHLGRCLFSGPFGDPTSLGEDLITKFGADRESDREKEKGGERCESDRTAQVLKTRV